MYPKRFTGQALRRAFLCGEDEISGKSFEHRREWIEQRILTLADIFSVSFYGYAVMHNHYHLVIYVDPRLPQQWTDEEVVERWLKLFPGNTDSPRYAERQQAKKLSILNDEERLAEYRIRLGSLTCMAYVDLNPIRAGITKTPEESSYTSIQRRIRQMDEQLLNSAITAIGGKVKAQLLTLKLKDYIELLDWTGKQIVHPNKASIPAHLAPIFERLNVKQTQWLNQVKAYGSHYYRAVGCFEQLMETAKNLNQHWIKGIRSAKTLYANSE